jgi:hypothetical protein
MTESKSGYRASECVPSSILSSGACRAAFSAVVRAEQHSQQDDRWTSARALGKKKHLFDELSSGSGEGSEELKVRGERGGVRQGEDRAFILISTPKTMMQKVREVTAGQRERERE